MAELLAPYLDAVAQLQSAGRRSCAIPAARASPAPCCARRTGSSSTSCTRRTPPRCAPRSRSDAQVKVMALDGWTALKALLPPKERRGVVLIDPPFEVPGELGPAASQRLPKAGAVRDRHLPAVVSDQGRRAQSARSSADLAATGLPKLLAVELSIRPPTAEAALNGHRARDPQSALRARPTS